MGLILLDCAARVTGRRGANVAVFPAVGICALGRARHDSADSLDPGALGVYSRRVLS